MMFLQLKLLLGIALDQGPKGRFYLHAKIFEEGDQFSAEEQSTNTYLSFLVTKSLFMAVGLHYKSTT